MKVNAARKPKFNFNPRVRVAKAAENVGQDRRIEIRHAKNNAPLDVGRRNAGARLIIESKHLPRILKQHFAFMSERDISSSDQNKLLADQPLQTLELVGYRRLRSTNDLAGGS